jgi:hypothetical protein
MVKALLILAIAFSISFAVGHEATSLIYDKEEKVLGRSSEENFAETTQVVSSTPTSEKTPTLSEPEATLSQQPTTPTSTPTPTLSEPETTLSQQPSLTPAAPLYNQEQVQGFITRFAGQYGVNEHVLRHIAICESGLDPAAINGVYFGLFQFNEVTWKNSRAAIG